MCNIFYWDTISAQIFRLLRFQFKFHQIFAIEVKILTQNIAGSDFFEVKFKVIQGPVETRKYKKKIN